MIRSTPFDDITSYASALQEASLKSKKKRILIIHGDPKLPNPILPGGKWDEDDFEAVELLKKSLEKLENYEFTFLTNHHSLVNDLQRIATEKSCDMVLQLCDEGYMNNPKMELHVTALLETFGIPYTGSGPVTLGITYDKQMVLETAKSLGIATPRSCYVPKDSEVFDRIKEAKMEYPLFIKPNSTDGSYGITTRSICRNEEDVLHAINMIRNTFHIPGPILVQEFLEGNDLNTAIIGNPPGKHIFLPITEEDYEDLPPDLPKILGFEAKWDENSPYFRIGTKTAHSVDEATLQYMNECSALLFERIGIRDYARFDWKLDKEGKPRLLEANPNCGWSYDAHLQRMCALIDLTYSDMLRKILESAEQRLIDHASRAKSFKYVTLADVSEVRMAEKQYASNALQPLKL